MPLNLVFIQPGTYTIDDNGIPGDNTSVIRDSNGVVIFTILHPADALGFTVSTPGVHVIVNFTDSMNAANFTIGSTNPDPMIGPPQSPDSIVMQNIQTTGTVTLVANTTITEGVDADAAADIFAGAVIMSAQTGIFGLETRTGLFEAETVTGGINVGNFGSVQIGGISADVDGLDVATSGDIFFTSTGSIFLTEANSVTAAEVVHGGNDSGNVSLSAFAANADIIGNVDNGAVSVRRGSLTMTTGRDIQLGTIGTDFNNDIVTNGSLNLTAGRDILIDGFADILSDNFGLDTGGDLVFTAGRNIGILNVAGTSASVSASGSGGGDALITTGFGGSLTVNGPGSFTLGSSSGDVIIRADRILVNSGSGISAPTGLVDIQPRTDGRSMLLGSASDAALAVELSNAELNRIFTPNLTLGGDSTGQVRVIAPIALTAAGNAPNISLRSGTSILVESNVTTLGTGSLTLQSLDDVFQTAASTITTPTLTVLVDAVDDDSGIGGLATLSGVVIASSFINGNLDADTLNGNGSGNTLQGFGGDDILRGFGGGDTLDGGLGFDRMFGGLGDDFFIVRDASDLVFEVLAEGVDRVFAYVDWALGADAVVETLSTYNDAVTDSIDLTGNSLTQTIYGNAGNNILDSGGGSDALVGLGGDDWYAVRSGAETVFESAGAGNDRVFAYVNYGLSAGAVVETLSTYNPATSEAINLTGNDFAQTLYGNAGANRLDGKGGQDVLFGDAGADIYAFTSALGVDNFDAIVGFQVGVDKIGFAGISQASLLAGAFRSGTSAQDNDDRIIYDPASGALYYDGDGVGGVGQVLFAIVAGAPPITASDFVTI